MIACCLREGLFIVSERNFHNPLGLEGATSLLSSADIVEENCRSSHKLRFDALVE